MEAATVLARSARFLVISIDHSSNLEMGPNQLYKGWRWE
jgi:hypothetical protein